LTGDASVRYAAGVEGRLRIAEGAAAGSRFSAETEILVDEPTEVEFLASASGGMRLALNEKTTHHRESSQGFQIDSDRFAATLDKGFNRLAIELAAGDQNSPVEFHIRFRKKSEIVEHERLTAAALSQPGDPERGRAVFFNAEKSQCVKCHRVADQGERIGPELTGLGGRFSRIYITESILAPGRAIAASFHTSTVVLESGKAITGIKIAEDETSITLADNQGQKHTIAKAEIEEQQPSPLSTMPDGLEKRISEAEFVDLVAYLASLKESQVPPEK
jgi:putative heme-binding domain-containing protein